MSQGIVDLSNQPKDGMAVGGKYSMFGRTRILSERFGVPPCQHRLSLKMAAPGKMKGRFHTAEEPKKHWKMHKPVSMAHAKRRNFPTLKGT